MSVGSEKLLSALREVGISGLCDILIVTLVLYTVMVVLKRTQRSGLIFAGIIITGVVYLLARQFDLRLTATLLQGFFAVILVALVVIFQEDLRYFFERIALWWVERRIPLYKRKKTRLPARNVEILARTLADLARARVGALVVIRGKDVIARHLVGGEEVDGMISEPLLKSIFDPHSLGHDGAVIIEGNRIARLGSHLPLSNRLDKLPGSGTRHAAALGLSELCDALCLVVSEERGTISVARRGEINPLEDSVELMAVLEGFYLEVAPAPPGTRWQDFFRRNAREKAAAFVLAALLWTTLGYRTQIISHSFHVPVTFSLLPPNLAVTAHSPDSVKVTFEGERRDFVFLKPSDIKLVFDLLDADVGTVTLPITVQDLTFPVGLNLKEIDPRQVRVRIGPKPLTNNIPNQPKPVRSD